MDRIILHSDLNNFYASVECLYNPAIRNKPVAVCGDVEKRHGIILAKNYIAKRYGVKTGDALWQAKEKCPNIVFVPPSFDKYMRYSRIAKEIYMDFSSQVESFGLDECWIDVSGNMELFGSGTEIANEIRKRIKSELGVTASIGVSWNKIFAKLGSDYKKPDATTVITQDNFKEIVWGLPASDLLYVGPSTSKKLKKYMIYSIGDVAKTDPKFLKSILGINGIMLWQFANGLDNSIVSEVGTSPTIKSIGNSTTMPYDVIKDEDVMITMYVLAESIAERLRENGFKCNTIQIGIRDKDLYSYERQGSLQFETNSSEEIFKKAFQLYKNNCEKNMPIRSISIRACKLTTGQNRQISMLKEFEEMEKHERVELAVDSLRCRFGHFCIQRGVMLTNSSLSNLDPKSDHTIHPVSFMK